MIHPRCTLLIGLTTLWSLAGSGQSVDAVADALARMEERPRPHWAFLRRVETRKQTQVARHDPRLDHARHGWVLEHVDGHPPDEDDAARFAEQVDRMQEQAAPGDGIANLVITDTLQAVSTNEAGTIAFTFAPAMQDAPPQQREVLVGTLTFDPERGRIETLSIRNTAPYSPKFAVTITTFDLRMTFALVDGHVLPGGISTRIQGKALLKTIDEQVDMTFSEYEWTGE